MVKERQASELDATFYSEIILAAFQSIVICASEYITRYGGHMNHYSNLSAFRCLDLEGGSVGKRFRRNAQLVYLSSARWISQTQGQRRACMPFRRDSNRRAGSAQNLGQVHVAFLSGHRRRDQRRHCKKELQAVPLGRRSAVGIPISIYISHCVRRWMGVTPDSTCHRHRAFRGTDLATRACIEFPITNGSTQLTICRT